MAKQTDPTILNPSKLRHKVTIRQETRGLSAAHNPWTETDADLVANPDDGWSDYYTGYAAIESVGGLVEKEVLREDQLDVVVTHLVTMRYCAANSGILPGMQVLFSGVQMRIQIAQNVDFRNVVWKLKCAELPRGVA